MKKSSKIILVVVIIIVIVLLALGGYYVIKMNNKIEEQSNKIENIEKNKLNESSSNFENESNVVENSTINTKNETNKVENSTDKISQKSSKEIANEAIKKALKDENWVKNNLKTCSISSTETTVLKFSKANDENGMPVYFILNETTEGCYAYFVTYKNNNVYASNYVGFEYGSCAFDIECNMVKIENNDIIELYKILNGKFEKFAESKLNENDNVIYYYVNGENVSYGKFKNYEDGCKELTIELNDTNIDNYIK